MASVPQRRTVRRTSARRPALLSLTEARKHPDTTEYGDNSVSWAAGAGKARRLLDTEYLWELRGHQAYRIFDQMRFSDPKIAGLRFAQTLPLLRSAITVDPADPKDKDAVAKADLVQRLLIDDAPWRAFLADTTLCMDYGFACFEVIWRMEEGLAKCRLALRPSSSIWAEDIYVQNGVIDHVVQRPRAGGECLIPGERILWFAYQKEGDDFRGRSILRPMYKPWKLKQEIEIQMAVLIGKMGGVPVFTEHGKLDETTEAMLDSAGESFGIAAGAFVRKPDDVDLELLASNARVGEVLEAIKYWDTQLSDVCMAQILDLGVNQAGSRALGTTLSDMFGDAIQAMASYREDVLNARGGLIEQLVSYNFPNTDNLPMLHFGDVQRTDVKALAQALLWLSQAGMNLGAETWDWVRQEMNLPESDATQVEIPGTPPPAPAPAPTPPAPDSAALPEGGAQASEAHTHHAHGLQLAERRPARGVEVFLDLADITATFDTTKTAVKDATAATRAALVAELVKRAMAAAAKGQVDKFAAGAPPMVDALTADVQKALAVFFDAGRTQVAAELQRQRKGEPWSAQSIRMADLPPESPSSPSVAGLDALKAQAQAVARSIAQAVQAAAAMQAGRVAAGTPVTEEAMAAMVQRESDAAALRYAGAASDFLSMGRAAEAQAQRSDIEDAVYSAILDDRVCEVCEPRDGETTTDIAAAESWTPNAECMGGDRCRCLTVYEVRQAPTGPTLAESVVALAESVKDQSTRPIVVNVAAAEPAPAPVVNVAAPTVNVAAAEAPVVNVTVPEPRRVRRDTKFTTDASGRITGKTETETES